MALQKFIGGNLLLSTDYYLTPSSESALLPADFLKDQLRPKVWRTSGPYVIVAGFNDTIQFNRSGVKTGTIAAGTYGTGAALATAVTTAMNTADAGHASYLCDYGVIAANTFRIRDTAGAPLNFILLFGTGSSVFKSIHKDLGFNDGDTANTTTFTADNVSYQSRHYLHVRRNDAAAFSPTLAGVLEHTALIGGGSGVRSAITMWGNNGFPTATPSYTQNFDDLHTNTVTSLDPCFQVIVPGGGYTSWIFVIDDVQNPLTYFQMGIGYLGSPVTLSQAKVESTIVDSPEDFSVGDVAVDGSHFATQRRFRSRRQITLPVVGVLDQASLRDFWASISTWENWFLQLDDTDPSSIKYGYFPERPNIENLSTYAARITFPFCEAM